MVKQISDNEIYLLIKYIKSVLWRVAKRLSYTEEPRCLKVNVLWVQKRNPDMLIFSLRVPGKGDRNRVSLGNNIPSPEPMVYFSFLHLFTYVCWSPRKGALLHTYGENCKVTVYGAPHRWKAYIQ